jgi:CDGSH-type Zn-finger protein
MLVRGELVVRDEQGVEHRSRRPVSAICRCGKSSLRPWCDGTHKELPPKLRP